jgi:hypothetical protein
MIETVPSNKSNRFEIIAIFIIATAAFIYFTGGAILNPTNVKWLYWGDPSANYLGWQFFRDTPLFQFPIGSLPNFGKGFSASIMHTESLPLIALPLKLISPLLPDQFQYFGAWIYASFIFQGYFAWKILKRSIMQPVVRVLASSLFLISPIFLYRLVHDGSGHISLFAQFLLLWAIDLYLDKDISFRKLLTVLGVSILTMPVLFAMVAVIVVCSQFMRGRKSSFKVRLQLTSRLVIAFLLSLFLFYIFGGFMVKDTGAGGMGVYRSTFTSLFDSAPNGNFAWSFLFPNIADTTGSHEGFAYLGIASLLLIPFVLLSLKNNALRSERLQLFTLSLAMALFALSTNVGIGNRELFSYNTPNFLAPIFETFRSSGRFTWLLVYLLLLEGIRGLYITFQGRLPKRVLATVFASLLFLQLIDMRFASSEIRERFIEDGFTASLTNPKWNELATKYEHLVAIPPLNNDPGWFELALLANTWNMTSNAAYYGRIDENKLVDESARLQRVVDEQRFDSNTLYVITNYPPNPASPKLIDEFRGVEETAPGVHVYELDGFVVVAP